MWICEGMSVLVVRALTILTFSSPFQLRFSVCCGKCSSFDGVSALPENGKENLEKSTCLWCMGTPKFIIQFSPCGHGICVSCVDSFISAQISMKKLYRVQHMQLLMTNCVEGTCNSIILPPLLQNLLKPATFKKWREIIPQMPFVEVLRVNCPNQSCPIRVITGVRRDVARVRCPHCTQVFCQACAQNWELGHCCQRMSGLCAPCTIKQKLPLVPASPPPGSGVKFKPSRSSRRTTTAGVPWLQRPLPYQANVVHMDNSIERVARASSPARSIEREATLTHSTRRNASPTMASGSRPRTFFAPPELPGMEGSVLTRPMTVSSSAFSVAESMAAEQKSVLPSPFVGYKAQALATQTERTMRSTNKFGDTKSVYQQSMSARLTKTPRTDVKHETVKCPRCRLVNQVSVLNSYVVCADRSSCGLHFCKTCLREWNADCARTHL